MNLTGKVRVPFIPPEACDEGGLATCIHPLASSFASPSFVFSHTSSGWKVHGQLSITLYASTDIFCIHIHQICNKSHLHYCYRITIYLFFLALYLFLHLFLSVFPFSINIYLFISLSFDFFPILLALFSVLSFYVVLYFSSFLAYSPNVGLCDPHAVCVPVYPPINLWMPEPIFMKLGYIMTPEPISTAYIINPSHLLFFYVYLLSLLDNGSVNTLPRQRIQKQQ
jgi:hypothetical protein